MLIPIPRGFSEQLVPKRESISANPELQAQYQAWEASRRGFLSDLNVRDPEAIKRGWQKDYFQGKTPDGKDIDSHQTRLNLREFEQSSGSAPGMTATPQATSQSDQQGQQG